MSSYAALTAVTAASVPNAAAGKLNIFVDIADGLAKSKDSAGTIVILSGAQALAALSAHISDPDAHLNYVTLTEANALVAAHSTLTNNPHAVTKAQVGLGNVDNTSDLNKPVSTATQTALNSKEDTVTAGTTAQYYRGDKTFQTLDKTAVGLGNVDNTSDINKPVSTAQATAISTAQSTAVSTANSYTDGKVADLVASSPAALDTLAELAAALGGDASFATTTATALGNRLRVDTAAQGLSAGQKTNAKTNIDLQNVENTSDLNKPVSTATQTALNLKVDKITPITPASYNDPKFTVNAQGQITSIRERVKGYADSNTDVSTTLTTNTTFITTNINAPVNADYYVEFTALYSHSSTNNSPLVDVLLDGVGLYSPDIVSHEEVSDNTATERVLKSGFDVKNLTAGVHTLALVFRCESGGAIMTMRYGSIRYEEL